jgi:Protein of unknown function, DUF481
MRSTLLTLFVLVGLLAARPLFASVTVELANGTKLVGTVTKEENGKTYFHADLIGDLVLDTSAIVKRTENAPISVATLPPASTTPVPVVSEAPPAPAPSSSAPGAPSEAAAAQGKAFWKRIVSVNGSYTSASYTQGQIKGAPAGFPTGAQAGLQGAQSVLNMSATLIGATPTQSFSLTGSYGYANYQPAGTVVNNHGAEATYTYVLSPIDYLLTRATYKVDKPSNIEHAFEQVFGFGHKFIDTAQTHLDVIPGISMVNDSRGTVWDDKWILSAGFLEHLDYAFNERISLEQRFKYRVGVEHTQVWYTEGYLGLKAAITEHISFTTGATYTYDNTLGPVPPAVQAAFLAEGLPLSQIKLLQPANKDQLLITSGIEYNW